MDRFKRSCISILGHVDSGKTTLSESLLYTTGAIRKLGRVDNKDAFLDTYLLEKERGITIYSKQAVFQNGEMEIVLLDTPGHVDFSAEMERTLQVLEYAILVVSAPDGIQGHTKTVWKLLKRYQVPTFIFVNKMDQVGADKEKALLQIKEELSDSCMDFTDPVLPQIQEELAMCNEKLMEKYLSEEEITTEEIQEEICARNCFPVFFGSALKLQGITELLNGLEKYCMYPEWDNDFGARVFKISRDEQGNRLTYFKVTGGSLKVRSILNEEKINQLRIYSGAKYTLTEEAVAGQVVAATGLTKTHPGQGFGIEQKTVIPVLEPVLTYAVILPEECDPMLYFGKLKQIEDEEPLLSFTWKEQTKEIQVKIMGQIQLQILQSLVKERLGIDISYGDSRIIYKETIANIVEGVGHFEPLRHYAEVHIKLEPQEAGSGISVSLDCKEDDLSKNWQRLILTHLMEKEYVGVLTGSALTDVKMTLVAGKAHQKHTEGGDFRQATYRAVRQGLMQAENVLLEPMYEYFLEVPSEMVGRALSDLERKNATFEGPQLHGEMASIHGIVPVSTMQNYQTEVMAYTKGRGSLVTTFYGYAKAHDAQNVILNSGYIPDLDLDNPSSSVFCAHGAGFVVPWDEVYEYMHLPSVLEEEKGGRNFEQPMNLDSNVEEKKKEQKKDYWATEKELQEIFEKTYGAVKRNIPTKEKSIFSKPKEEKPYVYKSVPKKDQYLLVDGYNVIFAWESLQTLANADLGAARTKLMDVLSNYQGFHGCNVILVFDAYRLEGHACEIVHYHNIQVVYTKQAETADRYIERTAHEMGRKYDVTVVTSDGMEQVIIIGAGCHLVSAREFEKEIMHMEKNIRTDYLEQQKTTKRYLFDGIKNETMKEIQKMKQDE